jgi:hypothetical protein
MPHVVVAQGYLFRHRCDNRRGINPDHLEFGSRAENLQDQRYIDANGGEDSLPQQTVPLAPVNTVSRNP